MLLQALLLPFIAALENGLARTPPMGWNNWNAYGCAINESIVLENAKVIVSSGLRDIGYTYIVIDDCWSTMSRDPTTHELIADPVKFPRGMKALADELHTMDLRLGLYADAGVYTCARYPGSLGYEELDARTFAGWNVDYLKVDNCNNAGQSGTPKLSHDRYKAFSDAVLHTGREMIFSMCNWGEDYSWNWLSTIANAGRMSGDVSDTFDRFDDRCPCETFDCVGLQGHHCSIMNIIEKAAPIGQKAHIGAWLDMDILEVGNGQCTRDEYVTHFSMWALLKSPLMLGNKLMEVDEETMSIIANKEIIAINQDALGKPAVRVYKNGTGVSNNIQIYLGELSDGYVVALLNSRSTEQRITASFDTLFIDFPDQVKKTFHVRDLWQHRGIGPASGSISATVRSHSTHVYKLTNAHVHTDL